MAAGSQQDVPSIAVPQPLWPASNPLACDTAELARAWDVLNSKVSIGHFQIEGLLDIEESMAAFGNPTKGAALHADCIARMHECVPSASMGLGSAWRPRDL